MFDKRIVVIHSVDKGTFEPKRFIRYIKIMRFLGYEFVSVEHILSDKSNKRRRLALTIDDGYKSCMTTLLPILNKYEIPALLFIPTGLLGLPANHKLLLERSCYQDHSTMTEEDINNWISNGFEIGYHTFHHIDLFRAEDSEIDRDFRIGMQIIEKNDWPVRYFAYPLGFLPKNRIGFERLMAEYNILYAFALTWGKVNLESPYYINRICLGNKEYTIWSVAKSIGFLDKYFFKHRVYPEQIK